MSRKKNSPAVLGTRFTKWCYVSDIHGDKQDPQAIKAFFEFCDSFRPDMRICGGDIWDFRPLRKKADEEERRESLAVDYSMGMEFMNKYQPHVFLRGNHDERIWDMAEKCNGVISDYCGKLSTEIEADMNVMGCLMLPYDKEKGVYRFGDITAIHGFSGGIGACRKQTSVYAQQGYCLMGHGHVPDFAKFESYGRREGYMAGCLCKRDLVYNRSQINTLRQEHGWLYGIQDKNTKVSHVFMARRINDVWAFMENVRVL